HGDWAEITPYNTLIIHGRADTVLKPGGVRIGTAEIYRVLEGFPGLEDMLVFGHAVDNDEEIVLCVVTRDGVALDDGLRSAILERIRAQASPRHVPRHLFHVRAVPYTVNGK